LLKSSNQHMRIGQCVPDTAQLTKSEASLFKQSRNLTAVFDTWRQRIGDKSEDLLVYGDQLTRRIDGDVSRCEHLTKQN